MSEYIVTKYKNVSVVNLSNSEKIFCKIIFKEENKVIRNLEFNLDLEVDEKLKEEIEIIFDQPIEVLCLFSDKNLLGAFNEGLLNKFIKKNIFNKYLVSKYTESGYIEKIICSEKNEKINKYGCKKIDKLIDSLIENELIIKMIFEKYKNDFASRFIIMYKRSKVNGEVSSFGDVLRDILIDHMTELVLKKVELQ